MNPQEVNEFLKQGFKNYVQAAEAVDFFREELGKRIVSHFMSRRYPEGFKLEDKRNPVTSNHDEDDTNGRYIGADVDGKLGKRSLSIEAGLWWNAPGLGHEIVAYAGFNEGAPLGVTAPPGCTLFNCDGWEYYVVPLSNPESWSTELNTAFDALIESQRK